MLETMLVIAAGLAVGMLIDTVINLIDSWGEQDLPEQTKVEMSETDQKMIQQTKALMQECFGDDVVERFRSASNLDRINMTGDFAKRLAALYNLDIDVDVVVDEAQHCGAYNWKDQKAVFNIILMTVEKDNTHFDYCIKETLDTIIHELRHAVQHKAIQVDGFWNVDEERRIKWANNMAPGNYIRPNVDRKGYVSQPIEADAFTFAAAVMQGVQ
jgi:hypothetical protein